LQLIDNMDAMLEADEAANKHNLVSTNFQKASCTVETSVKIYSARVDAVHADTYKMLGGLNRGGKCCRCEVLDDYTTTTVSE
jgi:condensin complex subunit 2